MIKKNGGRYWDRTNDHYDVNVGALRYLYEFAVIYVLDVLQSFVGRSRQSWAIMDTPLPSFMGGRE